MADLHKKLEDLKEKEKVIKAQQKQVQAQINQKERKERTRRLIKTGAAVEALMKEYGCIVTQESIDIVLKHILAPGLAKRRENFDKKQSAQQTEE